MIRDHRGPYWTLQDHMGPHGTIQEKWEQTGPYKTIWDHVPHDTIWYPMVPCRTKRYHMEPYQTIWYHTILYQTVPWGNLLRIVPPQKKGDFLKFCFYSTLKVSNITLMVLGLKSNNWASLFLLTLSVIANYLIMSHSYLLLFFKILESIIIEMWCFQTFR